MAPNVQIFVALLDEGTSAWRPVIAAHDSSDIYRILSENVDPEDEHWQFQTGELVRCKPHVFADGSKGLVAFEKAPHVVPKQT